MALDLQAALEAIWGGATADSQEGTLLEFKTIGRSIGDTLTNLAEAAACFANAQGGFLIVGIKDRLGGPAAFIGAEALDPDSTVNRIYELTEPGLIVMAETLRYQDVALLQITVPRSPDVHQVSGKASERVGKSCRPMTAARISAVLSDRRSDDWSAKGSGVPIDAVSQLVQATVRERLARSSSLERNTWAELPWPDICRRIGVANDHNLNHAGWSLLADSSSVMA